MSTSPKTQHKEKVSTSHVEATSRLFQLPDHIQKVAGVLAGLATIVGALVGAGKWIVGEVSATTLSRIDTLESKIDTNQQTNELATTRLELMMLMEHNPDNVVEIEKLAKYYFSSGGDWYMTSLYSQYAKEHGADTSFVVK